MDERMVPTVDTNASGSRSAADMEAAVLQRYGSAAQEVETCLCLPVSYARELLKVLPEEILEKDYGCGDPSRHVRAGETVLDLGSGSGKACYIIAQIVGAQGKVIGVDFNPPMLELARKHQKAIGDKLGYHNVEFRRGKVQDLSTDLEMLDRYLQEHPVRSVADLARLEAYEAQIRLQRPLIADESVDVIVSNCVLNLVRSEDKKVLFGEMYRVLRRGGRIVISDIVSDEPVPEHLAQDRDLWSACVSGAFQ
jgi:arsenite methyltransferase